MASIFSGMIIIPENRLALFIEKQANGLTMEPAVHFVISAGMALIIGIRHRHRYLMAGLLGLAGMAPDIDHFLPHAGSTGLLHNTLALGMVPLALLMGTLVVEEARGRSMARYQQYLVALTVILLGHLVLDIIAGGTVSLDPLSPSGDFRLVSSTLVEIAGTGAALQTGDLAWLLLLAMTLLGHYAVRYIFNDLAFGDPGIMSAADLEYAIIARPVPAGQYRQGGRPAAHV